MTTYTRLEDYLSSCSVRGGFTVSADCEHGLFSALLDKRGVPLVFSEDHDFLETLLELAIDGLGVPKLKDLLESSALEAREMQSEIDYLNRSILDMGEWESKYEELLEKHKKEYRERRDYEKERDVLIAKMSADAHNDKTSILQLHEQVSEMQAIFDLNGIMGVVKTSSV